MGQSEDHIYLQTVPRAIAAMAKTYPSGYAGYRHSHRRAQFLYAAVGTLRLTMAEGVWLVPPCRAVWLPPEYPHRTGSIGKLEMRTLYVEPASVPDGAPLLPRMLAVSPLLHHLVLRACSMDIEYDESGHDGLLLQGLLGEINWTPTNPLSLPTVRDPRLKLIQERVLHAPRERLSLELWSREFGLTSRTLTRIIQREIGISFRIWQDRILTFAAIPMITAGQPLVEIAEELGFETAWSFTAMFKRSAGVVPSKFARPS